MVTLNQYLKETFGTKVYKISLNTGCTCPNRDGTLSYGGCTFCSAGGSGEFSAAALWHHEPENNQNLAGNDSSTGTLLPISKQLDLAKSLVDSKFPKSISPEDRKYIAYFQSFTNTYVSPNQGPTFDELCKMFSSAASDPQVVAISIGTRPDCVDEPMMDFLTGLNRTKPVWVELGLQTIHSQTAASVNRGYNLETFEKIYAALKANGLTVVVHLIFGLPGEDEKMMLESVEYLSKIKPELDGIKLQNLQILKGSKLEKQFSQKPWHIFTMEEYTALLKKALALIPEKTVIHRLTGDGPKSILVEPKWSGNKKIVMNYLKQKLGI